MSNEQAGDMDKDARVRLAHGGGGQLMRELVRDYFAATFAEGGADAVLNERSRLPRIGAGTQCQRIDGEGQRAKSESSGEQE